MNYDNILHNIVGIKSNQNLRKTNNPFEINATQF